MKSSSSWSTTTSAPACRRRHRPTRRTATSASSNPTSSCSASVSEESSGTSARASEANGRRPGVAVTHRQPEGRAGTSPARTNDVLPTPEGPMRDSIFRRCSFSHSAETSASRPKKLSRCSSVNGRSPGYGPASETLGLGGGRGVSGAPAILCSARARSWAEWKRSSGRFSRHRSITRSSASGSPRPLRASGSSRRIAAWVSTPVVRRKGCRPDTIS